MATLKMGRREYLMLQTRHSRTLKINEILLGCLQYKAYKSRKFGLSSVTLFKKKDYCNEIPNKWPLLTREVKGFTTSEQGLQNRQQPCGYRAYDGFATVTMVTVLTVGACNPGPDG
uniref:Uncharacterized protein n=1 Tax=Oryza sativa subsp. japonica TaxID=39947 RepID=Q2QUI8_ORYSJ|nr:hypothetical protein LOC_Os12g16120 [Oryza sativa Japonica Group]